MITGYIISNGDTLKAIQIDIAPGHVNVSHINKPGDNGAEGGITIERSELPEFISLLTSICDVQL